MGSIHVLPVHLVNKIAAGEVIERPASVVKELIENALDAGAGRVDVAIEKGGRHLISVTDDGGGMSAEDAAMAFVPHATSKIHHDEDLFAITTMGFRGEALASIASISHAHIRTRRRDEAGGWEVEADSQSIAQVRPCAGSPGTTVTIRDLFFNTPARRKFLKGDSTELGHISEAVARVALARRDVAFSLTHNARSVLNLPIAAGLLQRVSDLFGQDAAEGLLEVRAVPTAPPASIAVDGLTGSPAMARSTARWQYFFVNGRYVRDRNLNHALKEAYRGLVDPQRYPAAFLFINLPPDAVDVNVHPAKTEVRFRDSQSVHSHVLAALRQTLQSAELRPAMQLPGPFGGADEPPLDERRQGLRQAMVEFFKNQSPLQGRLHFPQAHDRPSNEVDLPPAATDPRPDPPPRTESWNANGAAESFVPPTIFKHLHRAHAEEASVPPVLSAPALQAHPAAKGRDAAAAMQVHNCYLIVSDEQGLLIIDQHALHERILYDQLLQRIAAGPLEGQGLLIPAPLKVTPAQRAAAEEHADLLGRLGIEAADFGPGTMAVHRFPSFLGKVDPAGFLADALDKLVEGGSAVAGEVLLHDLLDMMACKAAVKAGDALTQEEIVALLARRDAVEKASACPHGRPTQIRLTLKDLERQFKRA